jgi:Mce-associated membrane protein
MTDQQLDPTEADPTPTPAEDIAGKDDGAGDDGAGDDGAGDDDAALDETGPSRGLVRALAVLAGVSLLGAVLMGIVAGRLAGNLDKERGERQAATRTASQFADQFLTYDYEHLDRTKSAVLRLSTGKFRKEYQQGVSALDQIFLTTKSRASVVVKDVFTGQIEAGTVSVVVVADQAVEGISGVRRRLDAWLQLDLVKAGSRWLVDGVTSLNFGQTPGPPGSEAAPPTTEAQANG